MSERRERYRAAIRENDGWVLDDGQHMIDAVMAVADAELESASRQIEARRIELLRVNERHARLSADRAAEIERLSVELRTALAGWRNSQSLTEHYRKAARKNASELGKSWDESALLRRMTDATTTPDEQDPHA